MSPLAIVMSILSGLFMSPSDSEGGAIIRDVSSLEIVFTGLRAEEGQVRVGLYGDQSSWDGRDAIDGGLINVDGLEVRIRFDDLAPGTYGVMAYHDRDGNGELNTGLFGIPSEPFAFSNDARGRMGPASWEDAAFEITSGENQHAIRLR
ncbi:DUF2141 domain-containing protein [Hyphobacterium sp.]|uniref:DUF2141 domain-containing protein n=1 Tax=Hyphobacterium sp. TaxID=2004662 RepID=UPI003BAD34AE